MRHRISLHLTGSSAADLIRAARACEDAGVHSLIASELYTNPFVPLAAVASSTSRIGLGTGIALAFVRSPLSLALEALDLDALTSGRFTLGLGTGVKTLNEQWHGVTNFGPPVRTCARWWRSCGCSTRAATWASPSTSRGSS
jgi:alkanesulfonate monooxygenase SsuD/methylene tetrahydromethanopterin reductase-like flavin-dependent oxidoreductase (luciferase family)